MNRTKVSDLLTGKNIWSYYKLFNKTQWFSQNEMKHFQIEKLKKLLLHCYHHVEYYRSVIDTLKINIQAIDSLDILKEFPILTKEIIQQNSLAFTPSNNKSIKGIKTSQTGGTTGNILFKRSDSNSRSAVWASFKRFEDWMGINSSDRTLILKGGHVMKRAFFSELKTYTGNLLNNSKFVNIYNTSDETRMFIIKLLKSKKYQHLRSYPQFLFSLAQDLNSMNLRIPLSSITTTAEPLTETHRDLFREVFLCETFDQYGCGEIGGISYECNAHKGMHITEEHVIVETNANNDLLITDLDNFTMPFIRYHNADQAIIDNTPCPCGRHSPRIQKLLGRTCDYIIGANGKFLHWAYFWHLFFDSNIAAHRNLRKFQIVQINPQQLNMTFVADKFSEEEKDLISRNITERAGTMNITFIFADEIKHNESGKFRPVINHLL